MCILKLFYFQGLPFNVIVQEHPPGCQGLVARTVQEASPLQGGCESETSQLHLCASVLDFSDLFLPSPAPGGVVMQ